MSNSSPGYRGLADCNAKRRPFTSANRASKAQLRLFRKFASPALMKTRATMAKTPTNAAGIRISSKRG